MIRGRCRFANGSEQEHSVEFCSHLPEFWVQAYSGLELNLWLA